MKKVLHICPSLGSGGIEKLICQWNEMAVQENIRFVFAVYNSGGETYNYFKNKGYHIYVIPQIKKVGYKNYCNEITSILNNENIDIVHTNAGPLTWVALKVAMKCGISKRIVHAHTNRYYFNGPRWYKKIVLSISRILNNKYSTNRIACGFEAGQYCFGKNNFLWIKNGIDLNVFTYSEMKRKTIRELMKIPIDAKVVGFVGRLAAQKNPLFALNVFKQAQEEDSTLYLLIVGEGPLRSQMESLIASNEIKNVKFAGTTSNISPYYSAMDVLLFPSLYEGLPIVTIEAQATGLPIIVSDMVPKSIQITPLVHWKKLVDDINVWSKEIITTINSNQRRSYSEEIKKAGYDKRDTVTEMISVYKEG